MKFRTKPEIALAQIRTALAAGVAPGVLLTDAGYGADGAFRSGVTASGLAYVVGVQSTLSVWPPGAEPLPPKPWSGRGRPPSRMRRDGEHIPVSAKTLASRLPEAAWRIVPWREGSNEILSSRFAAVRIRPASRDWKVSTPHPLEWLLIEWPEGEKEPTKYWLSITGIVSCLKSILTASRQIGRRARTSLQFAANVGVTNGATTRECQ